MPKLEYKYIFFKVIEKKSKTVVYGCYNNSSKAELAIIKWLPAWRQYCFFPSCPAVYSKGCLNDILSFIEEIDKERRIKQ
jgi:hypothetical protein